MADLPDPRPAPPDVAEAVEDAMRKLYSDGVYATVANWAAGYHAIYVHESANPRCHGAFLNPLLRDTTRHLYVAPDWRESVWENGLVVYRQRLILSARELPDIWRVYPERILWRLVAVRPDIRAAIHPSRGLIARRPDGRFTDASRQELELVRKLEKEREEVQQKLGTWAHEHHRAVYLAAPEFERHFRDNAGPIDPLNCLIVCDHLEEIGQQELADRIRAGCPVPY